MPAILPGATIGILGGGQLGRMTAMSARAFGYGVQVLDPESACPASALVDRCIVAGWDDSAAAADLARQCDVVTFDIERISLDSLDAAARYAPVRPSSNVLRIIQDRIRQKSWLAQNGFSLGPHRFAATCEEFVAAAGQISGAFYAKSASGGYDGRSQVFVDARFASRTPAALEEAWRSLGSAPCVLETALQLESEISVMVARRPAGDTLVFPVALNHHQDRILAWSVIPAPIPDALAHDAVDIARSIAGLIGVEGLLAVELFITTDGRLLVNELAPRPHNSFHATQRACATSQFEQHVRAVCDLPLGSVEVLRPAAIANLLGELWLADAPPRFEAALADPSVRIHLYEKRVPRPGRKMGHLSAIGSTPREAVERATQALQRLAPVAAGVGPASLRS